jgi:uncharacterized membrane protein YhaH (DUF805 family)
MFKAYTRYFDFQGRSTRSEYWLFVLFVFIVAFVLSMLRVVGQGTALGSIGAILYGLFVLASLIPNLAVGVRRLHDTNRSGWLLLLGLIPLVGLVLIYFFVQPGTKGPNKFGPDPLGQLDAEVFA